MGPRGGRLVAHHRRAYPAAASNFGGEKQPRVYPHRPGRRLPLGGTTVSALEMSAIASIHSIAEKRNSRKPAPLTALVFAAIVNIGATSCGVAWRKAEHRWLLVSLWNFR